jgi:PAS domain S-box-containing protein
MTTWRRVTEFLKDRNYRVIFLVMVLGVIYIIVSNNLINRLLGRNVDAEIISLITLRSLIFLIGTVTVMYFVQVGFKRTARKKDESFRVLFQQNHTPMWMYDKNSLRFMEVNEAAIRFYGYTLEEFLSMTILDIRPKEDIMLVKEKLREPSTHFAHSGVWRHHKKNGELIFVEISRYTVNVDDSESELVLVHDVTGHVNAELRLNEAREILEKRVDERTFELSFLNKKLQEQNDEMTRTNEELHVATMKLIEQSDIIKMEREDQLKRILGSLNDVVWSFDLTLNKHSYISPNAERIYGDIPEEMKSTLFFWKAFLHPDDLAVHPEHEEQLERVGKTDFTSRFITRDGMVRWLFNRVWHVRNSENQVQRIEGISTDVTYIKQTEKIIMEQDLKLRSVFDSIDFSLILMDTEGVILLFNRVTRMVEPLWKTTIREGSNFIDISPPSRQPEIRAAFTKVRVKKERVEYTIRYEVDGKELFLLIHLHPVLNLEGNVRQICLMARDITAIKLSERKIESIAESLKISNERYRLASIATNDAVWDRDLVTNDLYWGESYQRIFGHDPLKEPKDVSSWTRHIHPDDVSRVIKKAEEFLDVNRDDTWEDEYWYRKKDGTYARVLDRGYLIRDESGNAVRMIGAMQDITERTRDIEEIKQLSLVASKTENLVIITDANEKIEWVNEGFVTSTGYSLGEVVGKTPKEILQGPETNRHTLDSIRRNLDLKLAVTEEVLNYTKDGKKIWLKMSINPVLDDNGKVVKFISVETDVTIQRDYANRITAIARDLSDLITNAHAIIFGVDRNGYVYEWNKLTEQVTGFTKNEVLEKKLLSFLIESGEHSKVQHMMKYVLLGTPLGQYEFPIINKKGEKVMLLVNATPKRTPAGDIIGLLIVGQDITELTAYRQSLEVMVKERTAELEAALENQKELAMLKSRFASIVSHEFRTPLSTIKLSVNHIKRYKERMTPEAIDDKIQVVQQQVSHMVTLLNDVLTLSRAEENKIPLVPEKVDITQLLNQISLDVENEHKTHKIINQFKGLPTHAFIDSGFVRNIFINLLTNAIKFSPGQNEVIFRAVHSEGILRFEIIDKGIGIQPKDQAKIFEPFHRGSNVLAIQGTGLGLSIVKKAVDLLGGSISVSSAPDKGSIFFVTIPLP